MQLPGPPPPFSGTQAARRYRRQHPTATPRWQLGWRNIYVLPTRAGWALSVVLLVLLLASVNYQLSLGYLLTFLLAGSVAAGVAVAHANLRGLQLEALPPEPVFAGQTVRLQLRLRAPAGATRRAVFVALGEHPSPRDPAAWSWSDIDSGSDCLLDLGFAAPQRGLQALPRVTIQTLFPLGAFRLWSHWQPSESAWVYPAPETPAPPLQPNAAEGAGQFTSPRPHALAEPDGVRAYQRGDALRHIVWKKAAQALSTGSDQLVSRSQEATLLPDALWLDEAACTLPLLEARISRLTAWVQQAQQQQRAWGLRLSHGPELPPAQGAEHYRRSLQWLAMYQPPAAASTAPLEPAR